MTDHSALQSLAQNDVMNVRMEGLILTALVARGILSDTDVRELIENVIAHAPKQAALVPAYQALLDEFPG